ncbi:MAG: hypothetical protein ABJN11_16200 [Lentilitoribacter sp.]
MTRKHITTNQQILVDRQRLDDLDVVFTVEQMDAGPVRMAIFDDICGNLIQLIEMK